MAAQQPNAGPGPFNFNIFQSLLRDGQLVWRLMRDPRVPNTVRFVIPGVALAYLISPIDLIPDILLPVIGELDDLAVLALAAKLMIRFAPQEVVAEHLAAMAGTAVPPTGTSGTSGAAAQQGQTMDANYRVVK